MGTESPWLTAELRRLERVLSSGTPLYIDVAEQPFWLDAAETDLDRQIVALRGIAQKAAERDAADQQSRAA